MKELEEVVENMPGRKFKRAIQVAAEVEQELDAAEAKKRRKAAKHAAAMLTDEGINVNQVTDINRKKRGILQFWQNSFNFSFLHLYPLSSRSS